MRYPHPTPTNAPGLRPLARRWTLLALPALALLAAPLPSRAQWLTESFTLKAGWNAIYLHVDAAYTNLDELVSTGPPNPIQEVWLWNAPSASGQFVQTPLLPTGTGSEWTSWDRNLGTNNSLQRLIGNAAYLVRVATNGPGAPVGNSTFTWQVKGRPVPPAYQWTSRGLNFIGFPTVANNPPFLDQFLLPASKELRAAEFYRYTGGSLSSTNPSKIASTFYRTVPLSRGQAFWIGPTNTYNRYFGPFEVVSPGFAGLAFGDSLGQQTVRLRNTTSNELTVTLELLSSELPVPAGQLPIQDVPPLLVRGAANPTNLTYAYTRLPANGSRNLTLQGAGLPGSEIEVVLGLERSRMTGPGTNYAGVLRFSDSLGLVQINIPASATVASSVGLWLGVASVTNVQHYLVSYQRSAQTNYLEAPNGEPIVQGIATNALVTDKATGRYVASSTNTSPGKVARPFPLRLIVHNPASGSAVLLQRVYYGLSRQTNLVVATTQGVLDAQQLKSARRISAAHLPWSAENSSHPFSGLLQRGASIKTTVDLSHDDQASNPFLHAYHPDHDNLNATFDTPEPQGRESYRVAREITLTVTSPADDFASLTTDSLTFTGEFSEVVTISGLGTERRQFQVRGAFTLNRVSDIATLTIRE